MSYTSPVPHPSAGVRIVVSVPSAAPLAEVRLSYQRLAESRPWLTVVAEDELDELRRHSDWGADDVFVLSWGLVVPGRRRDRKAKFGVVYAEAIGDREDMLPEHRAELERLQALLEGYDCIWGHTPWMEAQLASMGLPTAVLPLGWDPAMGMPNFEREKLFPSVFYGSMVGKRLWSVPALMRALGPLVHERSGFFGPRLTDELSSANAVLYLAHSDVGSFSTWRGWQAVASSAALLAEPGDTWPFEAGRHFQELPRVTKDNVEEVATTIREALGDQDRLLAMARRAHEEVALNWTTESIVDGMLVEHAAKMCWGTK